MEIGPSIMVNKRRAMYPGIYSLPDCTWEGREGPPLQVVNLWR
jgi:hypothetical protein